jgi:hypothetical protein
MLFSIVVYREFGNKRKKIFSREIAGRDGVHALEKAAVRIIPGKVVEIRAIDHRIERPGVCRAERDGVF